MDRQVHSYHEHVVEGVRTYERRDNMASPQDDELGPQPEVLGTCGICNGPVMEAEPHERNDSGSFVHTACQERTSQPAPQEEPQPQESDNEPVEDGDEGE